MAVDLGKQYGPLPLGAWVVVVGAGLGIAFYTRRQNATEPAVVDDQSGVPGVGTGAVGGWIPTTPSTDQPIAQGAITTNEQWANRAINDLIAQNYPQNLAYSAINNFINGIPRSTTEAALVAIALTKWGAPPQAIPPTEGGGTTNPPPATGGGTAPPAPTVTVSINALGIASIRWTHSEGATSYVVYGGPVGSGTVSSRVMANHLHVYFWTGMRKGQTYAFSVAARNANGYNISRVVNAKRS